MIVALLHDTERDDVDQAVLVETVVEVDVAGEVRHADRVAVGGDTVDDALRDVALMRSCSATAPKRSGSATPITSAPMHSTSRTMPPMPVAAPSKGTTCDG